MKFSITTLAASFLAVTAVQANVTMKLYQNPGCADGDEVPGDGVTTVQSGTCDTNVGTGWQSAKITDNGGSPAGTLNFYSKNNCAANVGNPTKGFSSANFDCLTDFGFIANAVGLAG